MTNPPDPLARLERQLKWLLTTGVTTSAALLTLGLLCMIVAPEAPAGSRLLAAGLIILIVTPMLRVVVSMVEYISIREWFFVMTTLIVLVELVVGVAYALRR